MATKRFKPNRRVPSLKPQRRDVRLWVLIVPVLLLLGALLDPKLIGPVWPLAAPAEVVSSNFTLCGPESGPACVIDGDSFKLGDRTIRIMGIDAPQLSSPKCPAEAALARRSADRLITLLNEGQFEMIAHRLQTQDRYGRNLMMLRRNGRSIGHQLIDEDLAHRYTGFKFSWC
ncbi:MAG: thermonuclease family protein [Sphingomicrobium sp.]